MVLKGDCETVVQCSGERTVKLIKIPYMKTKTLLVRLVLVISRKLGLSDDTLIKVFEFTVCFRCTPVAA